MVWVTKAGTVIAPALIARRLCPADRLVSSVPFRPQEGFVAEPVSLLKEHRRQAAAAIVIHYSPDFCRMFVRFSGERRNRQQPDRCSTTRAACRMIAGAYRVARDARTQQKLSRCVARQTEVERRDVCGRSRIVQNEGKSRTPLPGADFLRADRRRLCELRRRLPPRRHADR